MKYKSKVRAGRKVKLKNLNLSLTNLETNQKKLKQIHDSGRTDLVEKVKPKQNKDEKVNDSSSD